MGTDRFFVVPIFSEKGEEVKKAAHNKGIYVSICLQLGINIIDEFDFTQLPKSLSIGIKADVKLRPYQNAAANSVFWDKGKAHSGVLVLPCGSGKTLIGIRLRNGSLH